MYNIKPKEIKPKEIRRMIREGKLDGKGIGSAGLGLGYVICNLVVLSKDIALDFMIFCQRNPQPCYIHEVTDIGNPEPRFSAPGADLRTDITKYCIYEKGKLKEEVTDITEYWRDDFIAFLIAGSDTWEKVLLAANIPLRHREEGKKAAIYISSIQCEPSNLFRGPMTVSMRPIPENKISRTIQICSRFPTAHGIPIHIGSPEKIGIKNINKPDFGDPVEIKSGEIPVFWACGVTAQSVAMISKPKIMITHAPAQPFITDIRDEELAII